MIAQVPSRGPAAQKKSNLLRIVSAIVGLGLLALLAFVLVRSNKSRPGPGDPAPGFYLVLLDGSEASLGDLRGQVVVLNFWASWCSPCRQEAAELQEVWTLYEDKGVVFLGVSLDDNRDDAQAFVQEFGITYPNGIDEGGRITRAYGIVGLPGTFVIDREGRVAWFHVGEVHTDTLTEQITRLSSTATSHSRFLCLSGSPEG